MKTFFKLILKYYLKLITKTVILIHRPTVVAISGSINKSFFKDEVKRVLEKEGIVTRTNEKSFNTEIGLPLAILDLSSGYNSYRNWLPVMRSAFLAIFSSNFPRVLVLELGVSRPGDMKYLLSLVTPKISIITDITQRYLSSFSGMSDLSREYDFLVEATRKDGLAILNYDNIRSRRLAKKTKARVETFGFDAGSDWCVSEVKKNVTGQSFKITHQGKARENSVNRFGLHHVLAAVSGKIIKNNLKIINHKSI